MSPHLIRSFVLASLFSALINAEPCKPNEVIDDVEIFTTTTTTTTATAQVTHSCIDNKLSPPPKDLLCGVEGNSWTRDDWIEDETKFDGDELDCLARCFKARKEGKDCVLFEVQKGAMCWLYVTTDHQLDHSAVMSRHLVRSFILAAVLSPLVDAGPCKAPELSSTIESFTAILESSTELPTTTTEAIILTTTEAAETTTAAPSPEGLVCGAEGVVMGRPDGYIGGGRSESELTCAEDCKNDPDCKFFSIQVGVNCQLWSKRLSPFSPPSPWKWYDIGCFCDIPEPMPQVTQSAS
ncbi:unnamed protein product [Fusarium graminearum]|uniref:Apple domain-containing protein n=1 Tax=Gibberella zeae TaxID=5518 RepID=A0A4E9E6T5_GIBZA|nr:unnamed protein product [Fusarium graminearum]CAG1990650.1 unnamed protein product [Fusarium graminearum]CAG2009251.1 unnamed protein product [Fusarium graminearum]